MFVDAIEKAAQFTRAIHTIYRYFDSKGIHPGAATLFFVNPDGWALTCKHVAQQIIHAESLPEKYQTYKRELANHPRRKRSQTVKELRRKYGFGDRQSVVQIQNSFMNCVQGKLALEIRLHPHLDLALIHLKEYKKLLCTAFPVFAANGDDLKPGKYLCRLGYPFSEFTNFKYDGDADEISWTEEGQKNHPSLSN